MVENWAEGSHDWALEVLLRSRRATSRTFSLVVPIRHCKAPPVSRQTKKRQPRGSRPFLFIIIYHQCHSLHNSPLSKAFAAKNPWVRRNFPRGSSRSLESTLSGPALKALWGSCPHYWWVSSICQYLWASACLPLHLHKWCASPYISLHECYRPASRGAPPGLSEAGSGYSQICRCEIAAYPTLFSSQPAEEGWRANNIPKSSRHAHNDPKLSLTRVSNHFRIISLSLPGIGHPFYRYWYE